MFSLLNNGSRSADFVSRDNNAEAVDQTLQDPIRPGSTFKIADVAISNPFVLAPLAGLTNWPFRFLAKGYGAGLTVTEMASSVALSFKGKATLKLIETDKSIESPFCVQIFGHDPERLALGAKVAEDHGADIIDLNMGCPARKVIGSGNGASLLKDFAKIQKIVAAVVKSVAIPVTVKTRPAFSPETEKELGSVFDLLPILEGEGVAAICLHPRYASQAFGGEADWSLVRRLVQMAKIPVIGSGDIKTAAEALERLETSGAQAVMIGRAAKGQPWIFRQCLALWRGEDLPEIGLDERLAVAKRHAYLLAESVGHKAPFMLRSVLMWYTKGLSGASEFRARLCREENLERQLALLEELCSLADI